MEYRDLTTTTITAKVLSHLNQKINQNSLYHQQDDINCSRIPECIPRFPEFVRQRLLDVWKL